MGLLLNEGGADPNSPGETDVCPIMGATLLHNTEGLRALIKVAGPRLDVNWPRKFNHEAPLGVACYGGTKESIKLLLDVGASVNQTNDHGGNAFHNMACNLNVDAEMMDMILRCHDLDLVAARRRDRNWKWYGIDRFFELLVTLRGSRSGDLAMVSFTRVSNSTLHHGYTVII